MKKVCRKHRNTNCLACKGGSLFANDDPAVWMEVEDASLSYSSGGNYVESAGLNSSSYDSSSSSSSSSCDSGSSSSSSSYDSGSSW